MESVSPAFTKDSAASSDVSPAKNSPQATEACTDVDDEAIIKGFPPLLKECYSGELDFDEYIQFICNAFIMRRHQFPQYTEINWGAITEGIKSVIEKIRNAGNYTEMIKKIRYTRWIDDDLIKDFNEDELLAYDTIAKFLDSDAIILEQNCQNYIDTMKKEKSVDVLVMFKSKRFDRFDKEMANVTVNCYASCSQSDKNTFPIYFTGMWGGLDREKLFKKKDTIDGLQTFEDGLECLKDEYIENKKIIIPFMILGIFTSCVNFTANIIMNIVILLNNFIKAFIMLSSVIFFELQRLAL